MDPERLIRLARVTRSISTPAGDAVIAVVQHLTDDDRGLRFCSSLFRVPLDGGEPIRLTRDGWEDSAPAFRRDGSLAFLSNRPANPASPEKGHDQRRQIWLLPAAGGEPRPITDEPLGVLAFRFAAAADRLVIVAPGLADVPRDEQRERQATRAKRGPSALHYRGSPFRHWDHWVPDAAPHLWALDEEGQGGEDLWPDAEPALRHLADDGMFDVSPDGAHVAVTVRRPGPDRLPDVGLVVLSLKDGERRVFEETSGWSVNRVRYSPRGSELCAEVQEADLESCPRVRLYLFNAASGQRRRLFEEWDRWPAQVEWAPDGGLVFLADDDGEVPVFRASTDDKVPARVTPRGQGSFASVATAPSGVLVGLRSTLLAPPDPVVIDGDEVLELASLSGHDADAAAAIAEVEPFTVDGAGGEAVDGFLVLPRDRDGPAPGLLWVHGGPINQFADAWHWRWNALTFAAAGYAVALPNPRGSTGRGQAFIDGIWGNTWGAACFEDLLAVADHLQGHPAVAPERTAVMGGSFGGYMTNLFAGRTGDRFRCFVTHASVFHLSAFTATTDYPSYWRRMMRAVTYGDDGAFDRHSPHRFVEGWQQPALVIHGEKDYRVPIGEGLALYEELLARDVDAELLVFPDENHWILKPNNIVAWHERTLAFLERHLAEER